MTAAEKQMEVLFGKFDSALQSIALRKIPVKPCANKLIGPATFSIPDGVKGFNIINLGLNGAGATFADIPLTGVEGITAIPSQLDTFCFSLENDQNTITGPIVVSPPANHHVFIQYVK